MTSVPSDLVSYVRIAYKQATTLGLDLSLSKARKPEWLTENLHNPFRDWDGREHILATHARKAALAYKNLRTATQNITSNMDVAALLTAAVTAYTEAFNLIDRRSKAIETVEREEIYSVLFNVLNPLEQKLGEQGASLVDQSLLYQLFDHDTRILRYRSSTAGSRSRFLTRPFAHTFQQCLRHIRSLSGERADQSELAVYRRGYRHDRQAAPFCRQG